MSKSSGSSTLRAYGKKTAISRRETRGAWRSAWVYNEEPPPRRTGRMFPSPPCMSRIAPDLFNISEEEPVPPVVGESLFRDSVLSPSKADSGARI